MVVVSAERTLKSCVVVTVVSTLKSCVVVVVSMGSWVVIVLSMERGRVVIVVSMENKNNDRICHCGQYAKTTSCTVVVFSKKS